ncbi:JNK-interacting protein 3-like isoform X4 [Tigriopus californicus]|uniref:JNK-interacting protein 3-like isoform X4 n=1 Tax=Tigriopus californicus TaxID=6832 RepID=UPI0027DAB408|nr:JNK-interacting protein 3-like isoform X4 [Tigriopus californicus]
MLMAAEGVSGSSSGGGSHDSGMNAVMNDKVQAVAGSIYEEFARMMATYGEGVVQDLMPLVVNVLENLDLAYTESQELEVEAELLKEDNEQLVTQYEREKNLRKASEARLIELEDAFEGDRKENTVKIDSLTSIVKMFELKAKNSQDQIVRLEEKENELKKEYNKLHERYTDLFKTHIDYMERTKSMLGAERLEQLQGLGSSRSKIPGSLSIQQHQANRSSGPVSYGYSELENNNSQQASILTPASEYNNADGSAPNTLKNELSSPTKKSQKRIMMDKGDDDLGDIKTTKTNSPIATKLSENVSKSAQSEPSSPTLPPATTPKTNIELEKLSPEESSSQEESEGNQISGKLGGWMEGISPDGQVTDLEVEEAEDVSKDPSIGPATPLTPMQTSGMSQTKSETRTGNNLYQELSFHDAEALGDVDEGADITGGWVHPGEYASAGMGKEVENLIAENNELMATKNALNIVKDDLISKVDELTGEHEILREEIRSLQNIRTRLETRVQELETDAKKTKEELEKANKSTKSEEEDNDVPMAQRKRFTRVEMARVLMERNQYKERFMELQEAVRWTEMIRAHKTDTPIEKKNQKGIWKFFGNLFSGTERTGDPMGPYVNMKYGETSEESSGSTLSTMRAKSSAERKARGVDLFDGDTIASSGSANPTRRSDERKEQYKQVRAHVKKDDGRMQAYGWSLPAKPNTTSASGSSSSKDEVQIQSRVSSSGIPVPVPVYCRPLMEKEPGMKIWCAAGVNLSGGRTQDGGSIVGASIFYDRFPSVEVKKATDDELEKLDNELSQGKKLVEDAFEADQQLSSHVWICTSTHAISKVTVIDANSPADVLEAFQVCSSHLLCIASVPGAKESDYRVDEQLNRNVVEESEKRAQTEDNMASQKRQETADAAQADINPEDVPGGGGIGSISFVTSATEKPQLDSLEEEVEQETQPRLTKETAIELGSKAALNRTLDVFKLQELSEDPDPHATLPFISHHTLNISRDLKDDPKQQQQQRLKSKINPSGNPPEDASKSNPSNTDGGEDVDAVHRRFSSTDTKIKDGVGELSKDKDNELALGEVEKMSSVLPTMWLGSQSGSIYVHSSVSQWKRCIHSIRLKDSVLCIVHVKGRVLAALANGSIAIFHRADDGQWDLTNYHLLDLGKPHHSIRCMLQVHNKVWCGYRNKIFVIDPRTMTVEKTMDAHPRKESQVRQMAWVGDGVWVSIRLDSTLRLFHAHTHEHIQDVDIEPYVSKMLGVQSGVFTYSTGFQTYRVDDGIDSLGLEAEGTGKLGFSFVRITALLVSNFRLWMGTGNGVIISVPLNPPAALSKTVDSHKPIDDAMRKKSVPGDIVRVYTDSQENVTAESFIPYCNMSQAQLSFHGHRDAVKFFVSVPGHGGLALNPTSSSSPSKSDPGKDAMSMLVMSGGEGYIDFRIVEDGSEQDYDSHIMVWQLPVPTQPPVEDAEIAEIAEANQPDPEEEIPNVHEEHGNSTLTTDPGTIDASDSIMSSATSRGGSQPPPDETGLDAATYQRWNDQVESLLNNALEAKSLRNIEQYKSMAREQSVPPPPSPKEDFTQLVEVGNDLRGEVKSQDQAPPEQ